MVVFDSVQQRAVDETRKQALQKLQEAKMFFLENFCEDRTDGTTFDCRVLDGFEEIDRVIKENLDYDKVRQLR